jgi:hypothetical protein
MTLLQKLAVLLTSAGWQQCKPWSAAVGFDNVTLLPDLQRCAPEPAGSSASPGQLLL